MFCRKHIKGAYFFDQNQGVNPSSTIPLNLPEIQCFTKYMHSLGVNMNQHVVICDRGRMMSASRAWWLLRVSSNLCCNDSRRIVHEK